MNNEFNKDNFPKIIIQGIIKGQDITVQHPRPVITDEKTQAKYDLPYNFNGENIMTKYRDKRVVIQGRLLKSKVVGDKVYHKPYIESIEIIK